MLSRSSSRSASQRMTSPFCDYEVKKPAAGYEGTAHEVF